MTIGYPGVPTDLIATAGDGEIHLTWNPPEFDGASPITGYVLMSGFSLASLSELTQLGVVTSYLDISVFNDQTYLYVIAAINEAGRGADSDSVEATPFKPATEPGQVSTLVGDAKGREVTLQWATPSEDGGSPITGYIVLRGLTTDNLEEVATLGPVTSWTDEDLQRGKTYLYSVIAVNDMGEGEPVVAIEVKVPKKKADDGPGFGLAVAITALVSLVGVMARRRRMG
jgi:PGF-CTERM protein